jgi:inward rectifier potassium channel
MVRRNGQPNVVRVGLPNGHRGDWYHYLLVCSWPRLLALIGGLFLAANTVFAFAYLMGHDPIAHAQRGSFADAFFFSVQTMATIGYGLEAPQTLYANVLVVIEAMLGLLGLAVVTGLVFAKFSRPTARVLFSNVAIMTVRDGVPSLMFRMANQRGNQIVEARIHVVLALTETTIEGESIRRLHDLRMSRDQHALFALSWTAIHPVTRDSPLYGATRQSLNDVEAEIIVSLTGIDETFSQTVHARHSWLADEIIWDVRFVDILSRLPDGRRQVDYRRFHEVQATA